MTDNTRRSGRATKGQHPRLEETEVAEPSKKTGRGRKKNAPIPEKAEPENEEVRCVCGKTGEDAEDGRDMVCCEECEVWQHFECMDVPEHPVPAHYLCEQCQPADHKKLLGQIERGEKPWEDRIRERERAEEAREREEEEKNPKKARGKKGKKARPSTTKKEETETNGATPKEEDTVMTDAAPEEEPKQITKIVPESPVSNGKRKHVDEPSAKDRSPSQSEPVSKLRKGASKSQMPASNRRKSSGPTTGKRDSNATTALQTELVERIDDLQNTSRQKIAAGLLKLFEPQVKQAQKDGSLTLVEGQDTDNFALNLALRVEYALYLNFFGTAELPSHDYRDKFSAINHNIKANASLRDRLLNGELTPNDLSKMSRADMASKELQQKKAEMLKEAEKQHMLPPPEERPRIRRTHKGEEIVETEANDADDADTTFTAPIRKRPSQIDTSMKDASPDPLSATDRTQEEAVELPEQVGNEEATKAEEKPPLKIDTDASPNADAAPERKSSSTFNIQNVWSGIPKEPDPERARRLSRPSEPAAPVIKQQPDAEIDRLLQEPEEEDDAYSPVDFVADPSVPIWHGKMSMPNIAAFHGRAKYAAGANLSTSIPWSQLLPSTLIIEGRIDTTKADEYLCGLRYSTTTDLSVVAVTTNENAEDQAQFDKLFKYFTERKRYGVISKNPVTSVKDTYVVPLEVGAVEKPGFIELLDDCHIDFPPSERLLLLSFVIKMNNSPGAQQTPRAPDVGALNSPITANHSQPPPIGGHPGFHNSPTPSLPFQPPMPPQQYNNHAGSPPQAQGAYMPPQPPHQGQVPPNLMIGFEAARFALGDLVTAPVIGDLLKEAPNSGVAEFRVVRELMLNVPASQNNFDMLRGLLTERLKQGANGVP